jgi:hypothetical protein
MFGNLSIQFHIQLTAQKEITMSEQEKKFEDKRLDELTFEELKLTDPRYIAWIKRLGVPKEEMKPEQAAVELNLRLWQYQTMLSKFSTRFLITRCLTDNHMLPSGQPDTFVYKDKHIKVNFNATKADVIAFKPTFTEAA